MGLQMSRALAQYGATGQIGAIVAITLVRELGPVLSSITVAGRNASGIASELGSMKVTEQIDAMRALGTDPTQKLVTPRLLATMTTLPMLTVIADFVGLIGCYLVASLLLRQTASQFWQTAWRALEWNDLAQGLLKPFAFGIIISLVGCFYGMRAAGGTQGVGRATTQAVVVAIVWIFIVNLFLTQIFVNL
jgi:phospholipid/cholesterol/gamma-HCH transport system permease protein